METVIKPDIGLIVFLLIIGVIFFVLFNRLLRKKVTRKMLRYSVAVLLSLTTTALLSIALLLWALETFKPGF